MGKEDKFFLLEATAKEGCSSVQVLIKLMKRPLRPDRWTTFFGAPIPALTPTEFPEELAGQMIISARRYALSIILLSQTEVALGTCCHVVGVRRGCAGQVKVRSVDIGGGLE